MTDSTFDLADQVSSLRVNYGYSLAELLIRELETNGHRTPDWPLVTIDLDNGVPATLRITQQDEPGLDPDEVTYHRSGDDGAFALVLPILEALTEIGCTEIGCTEIVAY